MKSRLIFLLAVLLIGCGGVVRPPIVLAQNTGELLPALPPQFLDNNGNPVASGTLTFYASGTVTPQNVYSDTALASVLSNPLSLNSAGRPCTGVPCSTEVNIYLQALSYTVVLKNSAGSTLWTRNGVYNLAQLFSLSFATKLDDKVCHASQYTDTTPNNAGGKIAACVTALPSTGGTIDARGLEGAQTVSTDPFSATTKPIILILGAATYTWSGTAQARSGFVITGLGAGLTTLNVGNGQTAFSILGSNIHIQNLTFALAESGSTSIAIKYDAAASNVYIHDNVFSAAGGPTTACYAIVLSSDSGENATSLRVRNNSFSGISIALLEANASVSSNSDLLFDGNRVYNTSSGFNFNHPAATGYTTDISVTNNYFDTMVGAGGWGVGLSGIGVKRATVANNTFTTSTQELLHVEDDASQVAIIGNRFKKLGTTTADRGLIQIVNGAFGITIQGNVLDLTGASGAAVNVYGVNVTPGGSFPAPFDITIQGNTFLTKSLNYGVGISSAPFNTVLANNIFRNPSTADKAEFMVSLSDRAAIDSNHDSFYDPGAIFFIDVSSYGIVTGPNINFGDVTTAAAFKFVRATSADGSASFPINGFRITRPYTADGAANPLFPLGSLFDLRLGMRFTQNGLNQTFTATSKQLWSGTLLTTTNSQSVSGISPVTGCTFTTNATNILCTTAVGGTGVITISADGPYIPLPSP